MPVLESMLVAKRIENFLRDFLLEGYAESNKDHLINWNIVTISKQKGGLGIGNLTKKKLALLGK